MSAAHRCDQTVMTAQGPVCPHTAVKKHRHPKGLFPEDAVKLAWAAGRAGAFQESKGLVERFSKAVALMEMERRSQEAALDIAPGREPDGLE